MEFYDDLADILEEDEISEKTILKDCENWDSLSVLSVVATVEKKYKVILTAADIKSVCTAGDLSKLIQQKGK